MASIICDNPRQEAGNAQGLLLIWGSALPVMGIVLLSPVAAKMQDALANAPGGSPALGAIALTAPALAIALLSPISGYLVDHMSRRALLLVSLVLYAFLGMLPLWLEDPIAIVAARFALGVAEAVILAAKFTLLSDYFSGETLDRWIAYHGATVALAATFFYLAGGILGEISWKAPFAAYGVALPIALLAAWKLFEPERRRRGPASDSSGASANPRVYWGIAALVLLNLLGLIFFYIVPLQLGRFLADRGMTSPAAIGTLLAIAGLGNPIGAYAFRYLRARPMSHLLGGSGLVAGIGLAFAGMSSGPAILVVGAFVNQLGCGLFIPATIAALIRQSPPEHLGKISGIRQTTFFIGQFLSPLFVLQMMGIGGPGGVIYILAITNIIFGFICWASVKATNID